MMIIDTWLFTAICLFILATGALLRIIPGPTRLDRLMAINIAVSIACAGALALTISQGNVWVLELTIIITVFCFVGTTRAASRQRSENR
jgi:multisubunit Na+/H+ antiporter MnhF subunit